MEKLFIFVNDNLGELRALVTGGKAYFLADDIAIILGYSRGRDLARRYAKKEDKFIKDFNFGKGMRKRLFLDENGLKDVLHSVKTAFSYDLGWWLASEVLPEITKYLGKADIKKVYFVKNAHSRPKKVVLCKVHNN